MKQGHYPYRVREVLCLVFVFTALLITSGFYGDATSEFVSAGVYCNVF